MSFISFQLQLGWGIYERNKRGILQKSLPFLNLCQYSEGYWWTTLPIAWPSDLQFSWGKVLNSKGHREAAPWIASSHPMFLYQVWFLFVNPVGTNRSAFSFCCIWEVKEFEVQTAIFGSQSIRSHIFLKLDPIDPLSSPSKTWVEFWSQYITYGITDNTSLSWGPMSCQNS